jgi:hypothetical protein
MKTVQQEWESFAKAVFRGLDVSETQRHEMKKAFFAGATAMFALVQATGDPEVSEDKAVAHLDALQDEAVAFMRSLIEVEGL